jgi:hypothetical protein
MANGWKIAFWIVLALLILETLTVGFVFYLGISIIEKEEKCQMDICSGYDSFYYDYIDNMCYCFTDDEIAVEKYMGG